MTEPYLEILNKGKTLRVNTSCPFKAMDGSDTPIYLPNPVDIDAGLIQDNMSMIPLDPEHKTTLMVSWPMYGSRQVRLPMLWQKESKAENTLGWNLGNDSNFWYPMDSGSRISEEDWAYYAQYNEANVEYRTQVSHDTDGGVLQFPYWLEAGKTYIITGRGRNTSSFSTGIDGATIKLYTPDDKEVLKFPYDTISQGEATFIAPRTGFYVIKIRYPFGTNFSIYSGTAMDIKDFGVFGVEEEDPWGLVQYVKGSGSYDSVSGSGNFNLEINNYPFDENMYSSIGYLYLYPQKFDHFIQYGEEGTNEDN